MYEAISYRHTSKPAERLFAGLACSLEGDTDHRPPLVLLHGLTFDCTMWWPALAELRKLDPRRRILAVDLPGHGQSPAWPSYDFEGLADRVHRAVREAKLRSPVLVGHSAGAVVATMYASRYPARGVVNVDQWLQAEPLARLFQSLASQLRGPGFGAAWEMVEASMHIGLLPHAAQELLRSARNVRQDLVVGYLRELLDRPAAEFAENAAAQLAVLRATAMPYLFVAGSRLGPDYQDWLNHVLPQADVTVWPASGHFPHLAHPRRFAECLAATARWSGHARLTLTSRQPLSSPRFAANYDPYTAGPRPARPPGRGQARSSRVIASACHCRNARWLSRPGCGPRDCRPARSR